MRRPVAPRRTLPKRRPGSHGLDAEVSAVNGYGLMGAP